MRRPINIAPRNGIRIRAYYNNEYLGIVYWFAGDYGDGEGWLNELDQFLDKEPTSWEHLYEFPII